MSNFEKNKALVKRYVRGSAFLKTGRYVTQEEKDRRRDKVIQIKYDEIEKTNNRTDTGT